MIRILFICHGNICRSPMAEYLMKHLVQEAGCAEQVEIASAAQNRLRLLPLQPVRRRSVIRFIRLHGANWRNTEFPVPVMRLVG